jgi:hypothetical protein
MEEIKKILEDLERRDSYSVKKLGIPSDLEKEISVLCAAYRGTENREAMKAAITRKGTVLILVYVSRMATLAMQRKDKDLVDSGLVALDLSNVVNVDTREAAAHVAQLAFSAKECGVMLVDRATAVISEVSPQLLEMMKNPGLVRIVRDKQGRRVFWSAAAVSAK